MASNRLHRRQFFQQSAIAATVFGWHRGAKSWAADQPAPAQPAPARRATSRFPSLKLQATRLDEMRRFYRTTLGLEVQADAARSLTVRFGETWIEFEEAPRGEEPFYHFAFNISENKFNLAKAWLARRCPLLRDSSSNADEIFFRGWNAHAVYFCDPAGNIGELIARHTLATRRDGDFDAADILCASEIGLVSNDGDRLAAQLGERFGLRSYQGSTMFLGDEQGLFVLPAVGRPWIPERRQRAAIFAAEVTVVGEGPNEFRPARLPYVIRRQAEPAAPPDRPRD